MSNTKVYWGLVPSKIVTDLSLLEHKGTHDSLLRVCVAASLWQCASMCPVQ